MMMLERWYLAGDEEYVDYSGGAARSNDKLGHSAPFVSPEVVSANSKNELIIKLQSIMDDILAAIDPAMHQHLSKLKILPQIYGIRWLRLLFGREFPINDLLFVWDALFAFRPPLSLVDYVFVAMLEYIRHLIINEDYSTTLQYLMRYPPVADAHSLIQYALHIKSPKKFEMPQALTVTNFENITVAGVVHPNRTKDIVETKTVVGNPKQTCFTKQYSSTGMIFYNASENRQQHSDTKSFVAKIVDTLSDRSMIEKGLIRPPINCNIGGHIDMKASNEVIGLLQEQVSCLQSRLNDMDMMAGIVKHRITLLIDEQVPKITGNDDLKNMIKEELSGIRCQIENAVRSGVTHAVTVPARCTRDTKGVVRHTTAGAIEVGNEVSAAVVRPLYSNTAVVGLETSRLDTEMHEIRPHSVV